METYVDGGCYALADVGLDKIEAVISLGIGSNVAFERELSALLRGRHGRDVPVLAYDPYPGNFSLDHVVTVPSMQVCVCVCVCVRVCARARPRHGGAEHAGAHVCFLLAISSQAERMSS